MRKNIVNICQLRLKRRLSRSALSRSLLLTLILLMGLGLFAPAYISHSYAAMLDKELCKEYKDAHAALVQKGVKAQIDKGVEWGKANLSDADRAEIKRYMWYREALLFRCPRSFKKKKKEKAKEAGKTQTSPQKKAKPVQKTPQASKKTETSAKPRPQKPKKKPQKTKKPPETPKTDENDALPSTHPPIFN